MEVNIDIGGKPHCIRGGYGESVELCKWVPTINKQTNEPVGWQAYKFFTNVESALNGVVRMKVNASDATTLHELIGAIDKAKSDITMLYGTGK